jgi:Lar family restriction alleviation protein
MTDAIAGIVKPLLPCPFCGGEASFSLGQTGDGKDWHYIECETCEAAGPRVQYAEHGIDLRGALAEAWNVRILAALHPSPDALQAVTAAAYEAAGLALDAVADNWSCGHMPPHCDCPRDIEQWRFAADEARAATPADASAALARRDAQIREDERRQTIKRIAENSARRDAEEWQRLCDAADAELAAQTEEAARG